MFICLCVIFLPFFFLPFYFFQICNLSSPGQLISDNISEIISRYNSKEFFTVYSEQLSTKPASAQYDDSYLGKCPSHPLTSALSDLASCNCVSVFWSFGRPDNLAFPDVRFSCLLCPHHPCCSSASRHFLSPAISFVPLFKSSRLLRDSRRP